MSYTRKKMPPKVRRLARGIYDHRMIAFAAGYPRAYGET